MSFYQVFTNRFKNAFICIDYIAKSFWQNTVKIGFSNDILFIYYQIFVFIIIFLGQKRYGAEFLEIAICTFIIHEL